VTWLVYLNDEWDAQAHGGQLRVHERAADAEQVVGARGADLQIGWLRATSTLGEQPVFLDAGRSDDSGNCVLYVCLPSGGSRDLSQPFHANPLLFLSGGDLVARRLLIEREVRRA